MAPLRGRFCHVVNMLDEALKRNNAPISRVLRAAPLILNERSNILTSTEKPTTSKADPLDPGPTPPRQGDPMSRVTYNTFTCNMESSPH